MSDLCCKKCGSLSFVKSGHTRGMQRYKCRECGCQFTPSARRGVHPALKSLALVLYSYCGVSMGKIGRLLGVSAVAVLKWVRAGALKAEPLEPGMLEEGAAESITDIARKENMDRGYVSSVMRLTALAPDIITAILNGRQPQALQPSSVIRTSLPYCWEEQREMLGFKTAA